MQESKHITVISNGRKIVLSVSTILYVLMVNKTVEIHVSGGKIYETRMSLSELEENLGDGFIKVRTGVVLCLLWQYTIYPTIFTSITASPLYIRYERKIKL